MRPLPITLVLLFATTGCSSILGIEKIDLVSSDAGPQGPDADPAAPDGGTANDAGSLTCNDDSEIEPNDDLLMPTATGIPDIQSEFRLVGLAICPETDRDFFVFVVNTNGADVTVDVEYNFVFGELELELLSATGTSISVATPFGGDANVLRAFIPNIPQGTYYAEVKGSGGVENNYAIDVTVTP